MAFGIALSGLNAAQSDLNVTANNIANSATTLCRPARPYSATFSGCFAMPRSAAASARRQWYGAARTGVSADRLSRNRPGGD